MNLKRLKPWAALLAVIIMIIAASPATAANIDDLRKKQKDISSQIENLKQNINRVNNSKKTVVDEIAEWKDNWSQPKRNWMMPRQG